MSFKVENLSKISLMLDKELVDVGIQLAKEMNVSGEGLFVILLKLAALIHKYKLYGSPSKSGKYLHIVDTETKEALRINIQDENTDVTHVPVEILKLLN